MGRAEIFSDIKQNLKIDWSDSSLQKKRRNFVLNRIQLDHKHLIPGRSIAEPAELVRRFVNRAVTAGTEIIQCSSLQEVPKEIIDWLAKNNISQLKCSNSKIIKDLVWPITSNINLKTGAACVSDKASLTSAVFGIAETGTLMIISSEETPTLQAFLPDFHLVILKRSQIVGPYEEAWKKIKQDFPTTLPRNVNLITGPSRSADIEQTLLMGAHGPKKLMIYLINEE